MPKIAPTIRERKILFVKDITYIILKKQMFYKTINSLKYLVLFVLFNFNLYANYKSTEVTIFSNTETVSFLVQIAFTKSERAKGLMYRKNLNANKGMLFFFPESQKVNIWMKNTYIPLDIIFISSDLLVANIIHNAKPLNTEVFESQKKVKYVLEINSGLAKKYNIKKGNKVYIEKY